MESFCNKKKENEVKKIHCSMSRSMYLFFSGVGLSSIWHLGFSTPGRRGLFIAVFWVLDVGVLGMELLVEMMRRNCAIRLVCVWGEKN